jgi:hypothetical protein
MPSQDAEGRSGQDSGPQPNVDAVAADTVPDVPDDVQSEEIIEDAEWRPVGEALAVPESRPETPVDVDAADDDNDDDADDDGHQGQRPKRPKNPETLIQLVFGHQIVLFHDDDEKPYATFENKGHYETWPVQSRRFKNFLRKLFFESTGAGIPSGDLADALGQLEAMALFMGHQYPVYLRVAEFDDAIYVDLCDDDWRVAKITGNGWTVEEKSPVRFKRAAGMKALPAPERGGSLEELRPFLNVDDEGFIFYVAWLLSAFKSNSAFPVLVAYGEQGSAKSTAGRVVRELIDPNKADLRRAARDSHDLVIAASNSWVITLDNISRLTDGTSDDLCRLATGGGFSTRTLYTDEDETIFEVRRPIILNGIEEPATRGDLVDRSWMVEHPQIEEKARREERVFWAEFDRAQPRILGVLFDAIAGAIRNLPTTQLDRLPRMADAARWVTAAEEALGWELGTFMDAYDANREDAQVVVIESSVIGPAIVRLVREDGFSGTATALLALLNVSADEKEQAAKDWPKSARSARGALDRIAPALRSLGYTVEFDREAGGSRNRIITIQPPAPDSVPTVPTVPNGVAEPDHPGRSGTVWDDLGTVADPTPSRQEPDEQADRDGRDGRDDLAGTSSMNGHGDMHPCPKCGKGRLTVHPEELCSSCMTGARL